MNGTPSVIAGALDAQPAYGAFAPDPGMTVLAGGVESDETVRTCQAITKAGASCKAAPIEGSPFCVGHRRREAAEAKKAG